MSHLSNLFIQNISLLLAWLVAFVLGADGQKIQLAGAGASFPSTVYRAWIPSFTAYRRNYVSLKMSYDAVGSGKGKEWVTQGQGGLYIDYAGSDSLLSEEDYAKQPDLKMFPVMAG